MINRKSSINKFLYEKYGQKSFFGRDNLDFKCINMPEKQTYNNICSDFRLKKIVKKKIFCLPVFSINKI